MVELGQLERRHEDFDSRHVRIAAISNDDVETARATQADFPHLVLVSDADQKLAKAVEVIHANAGPKGGDTNAPTTFLVDGTGIVRWFGRPERFTTRYSPDEVLAVIDEAASRKSLQ